MAMTESIAPDEIPHDLMLTKTMSEVATSDSPGASSSADDNSSNPNGTNNEPSPATNDDGPGPLNNASAPKTDKPRPHVCGTCQRSFARLEHLKRHERSHTKEKPFECSDCTRCFARRDLLLRHQQKLHMTTTPSSRPKGGRRESASAASGPKSGRVRKNSISSNASGSTPVNGQGMRPRANTISHIDAETLGFLARSGAQQTNGAAFAQAPIPAQFQQFDPNTLSHTQSAPHNQGPGINGLPKLMTHGLNTANMGVGLRTAPPVPGPVFDQMMTSGGHTINPAHLQIQEGLAPSSPFSATGNFSPFPNQPPIMEDEDSYDWMQKFDSHMAFSPDQNMMDVSQHSQMEMMPPPGMDQMANPFGLSGMHMNPMAMMQDQRLHNGNQMHHIDQKGGQMGNMNMMDTTISPSNLQQSQLSNTGGDFYSSPPPLPSVSPNSMASGGPMQSMAFSSDGQSVSSASVNGSARHSSVTSVSTDSITDVTRQALVMSLSQQSRMNGGRRFSQPSIGSPLSPRGDVGANLPNTYDLQRFVNAYIQYFHPHFPFLHIPTLSFDSPAYTSNLHSASNGSGFATGGIVGGGGCLILAMAAIGALYEFDRQAARELFDASKKMLQLYLEERRKADNAAANNPQRNGKNDMASRNIPLWLVQAMLLNVVYGHNCGEKVSAEIASQHCTALVSMARGAELTKRWSDVFDHSPNGNWTSGSGDVHMSDAFDHSDGWSGRSNNPEEARWRSWIEIEERKRTLFAIFHMSSLLVSAYNHAPALMNSEVQLDLPCEEDLWTAPTANSWAQKGGVQASEQMAIPFSTALSTLLSASSNQRENNGLPSGQPFGSGMLFTQTAQSSLRISTFGCLALIDALHNYIWETRQRHQGRPWTTQETESMHSHIEPALRAWQAAWASNPCHSLERPNPHGMGPLSSDSVPLLDLAYVRLFVNLGTSKEHFWSQDFEAMSEELARGVEFVQHAEGGAEHAQNGSMIPQSPAPQDFSMHPDMDGTSAQQKTTASKRERHLRKAACYAADSLAMSDKLNVTFADFTSRELPLQSAMCAFDCAQVLAEWAATLQERVGRYLGILGRDPIDYSQMPAVIMLEEEDCKLFDKIVEILQSAEHKMRNGTLPQGVPPGQGLHSMPPELLNEGFSARILRMMGYMLERAAVWPVTNTMCHGLQIQASYMNKRAEASLNPQQQ